jgi:hypothetical protein
MKLKYIYLTIFILSILFFARFSWAISVSDLYPAAKVFDAATGTMTVPAKVIASSATSIATDTIALGLTKSVLGGVVASLAIAGAAYAGNALIDYLLNQTPSYYYDADGVLKYNTQSIVYNPPAGAQDAALANLTLQTTLYPVCGGSGSWVVDGVAFGTSSAPPDHSTYTGVFQTGQWQYQSCLYNYTAYDRGDHGCPGQTAHVFATYVSDCMIPSNIITKNPATSDQIASSIVAGLNNNDPNAVAAGNAAINTAAALIAGGAGAAAASGSLASNIHNQLVSAVSPSAASTLQATADATTAGNSAINAAKDATSALTAAQLQAALAGQGLSAAQIAAAIAAAEGAQGLTAAQIAAAIATALAAQGLTSAQIASAVGAVMAANNSQALTQEQVQTAVTAALTAKLGSDDVAVPVDPTIVLPEKLSLTTILASFLATINSLPMMNTLRGLAINVAGQTSMLCLNLPINLGGNRCFDCAGFSSTLGMIGDAFLGLTTLFSFIYVFKG